MMLMAKPRANPALLPIAVLHIAHWAHALPGQRAAARKIDAAAVSLHANLGRWVMRPPRQRRSYTR
jgi:hypothetical protein